MYCNSAFNSVDMALCPVGQGHVRACVYKVFFIHVLASVHVNTQGGEFNGFVSPEMRYSSRIFFLSCPVPQSHPPIPSPTNGLVAWQMVLMMATAFFAYGIAEVCGLSSIFAIFFCAITQSHYGTTPPPASHLGPSCT